MEDTGMTRFAGACAALGGAAWTAASISHASQPPGCVGDACVGTSMRTATPATSLLLALAALMMLASGAGLLLLVRRQSRLGRTGVAGASLCGFGVAVLAFAVVVQAAFYDGDFSLMPFFVGPGVVALAAGLVLVAWTVLRARVVPRWAGVGLLVGAVVLLGANEQTSAVLLAVPFGVAWLATGAALLLGGRGSGVRQRAAVPAVPPGVDVDRLP